jgi:hypothetical protein
VLFYTILYSGKPIARELDILNSDREVTRTSDAPLGLAPNLAKLSVGTVANALISDQTLL